MNLSEISGDNPRKIKKKCIKINLYSISGTISSASTVVTNDEYV